VLTINRHTRERRLAIVDAPDATEPDRALVELAGALPPGRAVDLGCGGGRNSVWLAREGWRVTAVDLSEESLVRLVATTAGERLAIEVVGADMRDYLARAGQFDLVVLAHIHPPAEERAGLFATAARAVSSGGHLFVIGHHLDSLGRAGPPDPARLYTEAGMAGAFPGLEVMRLERRERGGQDGMAPLVDLVVWAARPDGPPPDESASARGSPR
jgi:SAM-dependent methyltransferase